MSAKVSIAIGCKLSAASACALQSGSIGHIHISASALHIRHFSHFIYFYTKTHGLNQNSKDIPEDQPSQ